jgi:hypothetical protein
MQTAVSDAAEAQGALLSYVDKQTPEDRSQREFIVRVSGEAYNIHQWVRCCDGLPQFADYLDALVKRVQPATRN